ncbi:MAG: hypothetical protein AAGE52_39925 [Myxococcota bacterium]
MKALQRCAAALGMMVWLSAAPASADVVSDDMCHAWEHWEGAHNGDCKFGCRCAAMPGQGGETGPLAMSALLLGVVAFRRMKR